MENVEFMCLTSDPGNWCIPAFIALWDLYAGYLPMNVYGFTKPEGLSGHPFYSIGRPEFYPVNKWSDGLIRALHMARKRGKTYAALFLEDYWLIRPVSAWVVAQAWGIMERYSSIVRFDLTSDRMLGQGPKRDFDYAFHEGSAADFFISEVKDYQFSTQASLWRIESLLSLLKSGETPWEAELNGNERLNKSGGLVAGSYQWPVKYMIAVNKGKLDRSGAWMYPPRTLTARDWKWLEELGLIPDENQA